MKRKIYMILILSFIFRIGVSQENQARMLDSLRIKLSQPISDTLRFLVLGKIANIYSEINPDSAFFYSNKILPMTQKLRLSLEESVALGEMGYAQLNMGNYARSLQYLLSAIAITSDTESEKNILPPKYPAMEEFTDRTKSASHQRMAKLSRIYQYAGILYGNSGNNDKALYYYRQALSLAEQSGNLKTQSITYTTLGRTYFSLGKLDSALFCLKQAYSTATDSNYKHYFYKRYLGSILLNTGRVYLAMKDTSLALSYFKRAIVDSETGEYYRGVVASNLAVADVFKKLNRPDSNLFFIHQAHEISKDLNAPDLQVRTYFALADYYKQFSKSDSVAKYLALIIKINENQFSLKQAQQFQNIDFDEMQRTQQLEEAKKEYQNKVRLYSMISGILILVVVGLILYRNNRQKQKANTVLHKTLTDLKSTQSLLIQSEKMASLGELTAGIAHEIQNPLNFVNNFSEVSNELLQELKVERLKAKRDEKLEQEILDDISQNLEKITHHGKRAGSIVSGMLQHSRTSTGKIESTNINNLADEYLRLAFHGLRAKDKSFNADFKTDFDESIGNLNIVPQDMGRVILNLITNAFYAVTEKNKNSLTPEGGIKYQPMVIVSSRKVGGKIFVSVKDNGNGVPQKIIDKIFQPFFTTKPTGQGTGLGLSLAYDIVKAHGGELKVETKEGKGSEFVVELPVV